MPDTTARVTDIFRDLFDDNELVITRDTTAKDIEEWDSVMHVSLIIQVEKEFGVRFSSREVANLQNVGELIDLVESKERS